MKHLTGDQLWALLALLTLSSVAILFVVVTSISNKIPEEVAFSDWVCPKGTAPATKDLGVGTYCHKLTEPLPAGSYWDPLGNRPESCTGLTSWKEITNGRKKDCLRSNKKMPKGWYFVK